LTLGALEKWGKMKQIMILFGEIEKAPSHQANPGYATAQDALEVVRFT